MWDKKSIGSNVFYQNHLYNSIQSGIEDDEIERWFDKEFEAPVVPVIRKINNDQKISYGDMKKLINFLALQDVRTPKKVFEAFSRHENNVKDLMPKILKSIAEGKVKNKKINKAHKSKKYLPVKVSSEIEEGADSGLLKVETIVGRKPWLFSIQHLLEKTSKVLLKHSWKIIKPYGDMYWLTSDNPVIKLHYNNPINYSLEGGWNVKNANIFFPVGPKHALFTHVGNKESLFDTEKDPYKTLELNQMQVENSYRYIYACSKDSTVEKYKPRIVNSETFKNEKAMWQSWHDENSWLEKEFEN